MALISSDNLIEQNPQAFEKFRHPAIHGMEPRLDPALNRLVEEKLGFSGSFERGDSGRLSRLQRAGRLSR